MNEPIWAEFNLDTLSTVLSDLWPASLCPKCLAEVGLMEIVTLVTGQPTESARGRLVMDGDGSEDTREAAPFPIY